jgi:uncharacterized protein with von Willebrand factor type A (vWA) domain
MAERQPVGLGGVIHTYQKYDPQHLPSPRQPAPDVLSGAFDHLLAYGDLRELSEEELARAVRLDPRQIAGLGPSLESLMAMLRERKRKILETFETAAVAAEAGRRFQQFAARIDLPPKLADRFHQAVAAEQLYELEQLWYFAEHQRGRFAGQLLRLVAALGEKYQVDELAAKYVFTGRTPLTVPQALEVKEELETIDRLLKELEEAAKTAQIGVIDMESLAEYADPGAIEQLNRLARQIEQYLRDLAEQQGLARTARGYELTPKAYQLFQGRLLDRIFSDLQASRTGRHDQTTAGEGAVELQQTRPYEFGDALHDMDIPGSLINAMVRNGPGLPVRIEAQDILVHRTRNTPKCATAVLLDLSGSMRYNGLYVDVKRMGLALQGLIHRQYPGDHLQFIEVYTFAKPRPHSEIAALLPKPVSIDDPVVRLRVDMSNPDVSEYRVPAHFTNIQHGLQLARRYLAVQDTPNRQVILITDGLPTAHFEGQYLYLLYPPDRLTEEATLREGRLCQREGIVINIFLLANWAQTHKDVRFAHQLAESTRGRVFFTAGKNLDRYVLWDYLKRRREIVA